MLLSYCLFPPHLFLNVPLFPTLVPHLSSRKTYNRSIYSLFHEYRFSNRPEFSEKESLPTEKRPFPAPMNIPCSATIDMNIISSNFV